MKYNQQLNSQIEKFKDYIIIVEGKKDVNALKLLGFSKTYAIHQVSISLKERAEQIMREIKKKDKVCILTDFDKRGKQLYLNLKSIFNELGAHLDSTLRGMLLKARITHIEGIPKFIAQAEQNN